MIQLIFILFAVLFGLAILKNTGIKRLYWFFAGILLFPNTIILFTSPVTMPFQRYLIYILLLSELIRFTDFKKQLKEFPLSFVFILAFIGTMIIGIFDSRLELFHKFYRPFLTYVETFFILLLCYCSIDTSKDWIKLKDLLISLSMVICIYGVFNYITKSNPYDLLIQSTYKSTSFFSYYANDIRFRINSTTAHPIYYGYLLGTIIIYILAYLYNKGETNKTTIITLSLLIINLLLTNSRTPLVVFIIGLIALSFFSLSIQKKLQNILLLTLLSLVSYSFIPFVQEQVDNSLDIFITGGTKSDGSSMEMRNTQLLASLDQFNKSPIRGNGLSYIEEDLGWNNKNKDVDSDFAGFESYIFQLLIEQGLIGIIITFALFLSIYRFFIKNMHSFKLLSGLGVSILSMFIIFSTGTGTLGSWTITMGLLGVIIKTIEISNHKKAFLLKIISHI